MGRGRFAAFTSICTPLSAAGAAQNVKSRSRNRSVVASRSLKVTQRLSALQLRPPPGELPLLATGLVADFSPRRLSDRPRCCPPCRAGDFDFAHLSSPAIRDSSVVPPRPSSRAGNSTPRSARLNWTSATLPTSAFSGVTINVWFVVRPRVFAAGCASARRWRRLLGRHASSRNNL